MEIGGILTLPFMQKALLGGAVSAFLLALYGVFVILKRLSFFGDGIAHASLAGIAIGVVLGINPLWLALLTAVIFTSGIYFLERKTTIPTDAIIGLIFTFGMALGILIISLKRGYQPELVSFLFGNILSLSWEDILATVILGTLVIFFLLAFRRSITLIILDREEAYLQGLKVEILEFFFYIFLAVTIVLGLKLLGIVLVSAILIIPPITAKLFSRSFRKLLISSLLIGEATVIGGLFISYLVDAPSGAVIVLVGSAIFAGVLLITSLQKRSIRL